MKHWEFLKSILTMTKLKGPALPVEKNQILKKKKFVFLAQPPATKNVSPIGPAVWPAIRSIYMNVLFYYIDR